MMSLSGGPAISSRQIRHPDNSGLLKLCGTFSIMPVAEELWNRRRDRRLSSSHSVFARLLSGAPRVRIFAVISAAKKGSPCRLRLL
jgi:hypothetical protein